VKSGCTVLAACAALLTAGPATGAGDPVKGATLHEDCLGCHGTELYVPPRAKVKTLTTLKKEIERWNDRMNPKFTKQEIEDLVAYLNANFYKIQK
jgi:mono/diheme cytochrome c family protein